MSFYQQILHSCSWYKALCIGNSAKCGPLCGRRFYVRDVFIDKSYTQQRKFGILSLRAYSSNINKCINKSIKPLYRCINSLSYATYCFPISGSQRQPKSLGTNSEPQLTGKAGHQLIQLLLTVSQIVQFCTHVLGLEQNFCWSVKMLKWWIGQEPLAI